MVLQPTSIPIANNKAVILIIVPLQFAHIDKMPRDRRRRRHRRADQMGASALPLPPLKVAVGRRSATLARLQAIIVHRQTHRATGIAPLETRRDENFIQSLLFGLRLD